MYASRSKTVLAIDLDVNWLHCSRRNASRLFFDSNGGVEVSLFEGNGKFMM